MIDADTDRTATAAAGAARRPGPGDGARGPVGGRRDAEAVVLAAYEAYARDLNAFARSLVRDREAAEDHCRRGLPAARPRGRAPARTPDDVRGWLYRVTANLVISRGRRIAVAQRFLGRLARPARGESPEARHLRLDIEPALREAVLALPADARIAHRHGGARRERPGDRRDALGRSEAATRTLLTRARQRVRAQPRVARRPSDDQPTRARSTSSRGLALVQARRRRGRASCASTSAPARTARRQAARMRADLDAVGRVDPGRLATTPRPHPGGRRVLAPLRPERRRHRRDPRAARRGRRRRVASASGRSSPRDRRRRPAPSARARRERRRRRRSTGRRTS